MGGIAVNGSNEPEHILVGEFNGNIGRAPPLGRIRFFDQFERWLPRPTRVRFLKRQQDALCGSFHRVWIPARKGED